MDNDNSPTIADQFKQLPVELQQLITSAELPRKISLVAKKYHFNADQERLLGNEVGLILLILDSTANLPKNLREGLGVSFSQALSVSMDVTNYIFNEVTEFLVHDDIENSEDEVIQPEIEIPEKKEPPHEPMSKMEITPEPLSVPIPKPPPPPIPVLDIKLEPWAPLRAVAALGEAAHLTESTAKHDILNHIENPPRTSIKKHTDQYVIEHDIVTDPAKLIDDKVDNVLKLQEIYLD